jgi:hypothetical protein
MYGVRSTAVGNFTRKDHLEDQDGDGSVMEK